MEPPATPAPPFFIVGCPRSGTSLLRDLLRSHPNLSVPFESHFIPTYFRAYGHPSGPAEARRIGRRILAVPFVALWELDLLDDVFDGCRRFGEIVEVIFRTVADRDRKPRWGDKTPYYVEHVRTLDAVFPGASFIHLIRDARDVTLSWLPTHYEPENVFTAVSAWKRMVQRGREGGRHVGTDRYLEVRYEKLATEPEAVLRRVLKHLGEPFDPMVLKPSRRMRELTSSHRWSQPRWVGHDHVSSASVGRWRREMPIRSRSIVESVADDLLADLAYPVEGLARELSVGERAWWRVHHRFRRAYFRLRGYPNSLRENVKNAWTLGQAAVRARFLPRTRAT